MVYGYSLHTAVMFCYVNVMVISCYAPINVMPEGGEAGHRVGI